MTEQNETKGALKDVVDLLEGYSGQLLSDEELSFARATGVRFTHPDTLILSALASDVQEDQFASILRLRFTSGEGVEVEMNVHGYAPELRHWCARVRDRLKIG